MGKTDSNHGLILQYALIHRRILFIWVEDG